MLRILRDWGRRTFADQEVSILILTIAFLSVVLFFFGGVLTPVIAAVVVAYILEGVVTTLTRFGVSRLLSILLLLICAFGMFMALLVWFFPVIWREVISFVQALPAITAHYLTQMDDLPQRYPELISDEQVTQLTNMLHAEFAHFGKQLLALTIAVIPNVLQLIVYLILVPLLVYFFLKDGALVFDWMSDYFPNNRRLVSQVWREVDDQLGRYIRGKLIEIILVALVTTLTFSYWGLDYPILLGFLVGVSTLIPYIGVLVVSIPVVLLAIVQWGVSQATISLLISYAIIHLLDSQVLVPFLFSEALSLHPIAIFIAIILFGGVWGFWGVFFAIPLATLVKAVLNAIPRGQFL